jgi:hypothetical protein
MSSERQRRSAFSSTTFGAQSLDLALISRDR